ncbi:MAG: hypothetical protein LLF28_02810 [Nitrospiraceae bacterium]|nr:hypothetical protein [Nitrospiraceae bacterium]
MKFFSFFLLLFLFVPVLASAECSAEFNPSGFDDLMSQFRSSFPINLVAVAYNFLDEMSAVEPISLSEVELTMTGLTIRPFSFLSLGVFDVFFTFLRIALIALLIFQIVRHLLEYVI